MEESNHAQDVINTFGGGLSGFKIYLTGESIAFVTPISYQFTIFYSTLPLREPEQRIGYVQDGFIERKTGTHAQKDET